MGSKWEVDNTGQLIRGKITIDDVNASLKTIANLLNRPIWTDPVTGRVRVSIDAGLLPTVTTVTTAATVTTLTQIGGIAAYESMINIPMRNNWAVSVRNRITDPSIDYIENHRTAELGVTKVLQPDGAGGLVWDELAPADIDVTGSAAGDVIKNVGGVPTWTPEGAFSGQLTIDASVESPDFEYHGGYPFGFGFIDQAWRPRTGTIFTVTRCLAVGGTKVGSTDMTFAAKLFKWDEDILVESSDGFTQSQSMVTYPWMAQGFQLIGNHDVTLAKVHIAIHDGTFTGTLVAEIWSDDGAGQPNAKLGSTSYPRRYDDVSSPAPILSMINIIAGGGAINGPAHAFVFPSPISLVAGTQYHLVIVCNQTAGTGHVCIAIDSTGSYASGNVNKSADGAAWTAEAAWDFTYFSIEDSAHEICALSTTSTDGFHWFTQDESPDASYDEIADDEAMFFIIVSSINVANLKVSVEGVLS